MPPGGGDAQRRHTQHTRTLSSYTGTALLPPRLPGAPFAAGSLELPRRLPKKEALALAFILAGCCRVQTCGRCCLLPAAALGVTTLI